MAEIRNKQEILAKPLARTMQIERASESDKDSRTVDFAFSSSEPIQHWFGYLILDHDKSSVRLQRFENGAPLLMDHNHRDQVGKIIKASIDKDGKGRATAKFSRSVRGQEIYQDVIDGIREKISVGFLLHGLDPELDQNGEQKMINGEPVFRSRDWEPYEDSFVSVEADVSVGVGRSLEIEEELKEKQILDNTTLKVREIKNNKKTENKMEEKEVIEDERAVEEPKTPEVKKPAVVNTEISRAAEMVEFGQIFGEESLARDLAANGKTIADLKAAIAEKRSKEQTPVPPKPVVDLSAKEKKEYSITRALLADASTRPGYQGGKVDQECLEREVSDEIVKNLMRLESPPTLRGGILVPTSIGLERAGLDTATTNKGAEVVFEEYGGFIDLLRNKTKVIELGATVLTGLQGNISLPRQTGAAVAYWLAENPGTDTTESELSLDEVQLSPNELRANTKFSRKLLAQSSVSIDNLVMNDLAAVNARAIDLAALHGAGTLEPLGIYGQTGVNAVAFGGNITFAKVVDMESAIATANADVDNMAYLTTPGVRGTGKKTQQFSGTNGVPLWMNGEMNGYRAEATNQIKSTLGAGAEHGIVFGDWSQLIIGEWGALELLTDPYTLAARAMIRVLSFLMADVAVRHPQSFAKGTGMTNA